MTQLEIEYVKKLKELIKGYEGIMEHHCDYYPRLEPKWQKLNKEIAELGKRCQFEMLCDPDIFEASANEYFEQKKGEYLVDSRNCPHRCSGFCTA